MSPHPKVPESGKTRLITDDEMVRLFGCLERADVEGLDHPFLTLGIRLQFAFAARMSEIITVRWEWIDFDNRREVWPDSKTGEISKTHERGGCRATFERASPGSSGIVSIR